MDEDLVFYNKENSTNSEEKLVRVTGMYKDWFLDYASYVILERAIPCRHSTPFCNKKVSPYK